MDASRRGFLRGARGAAPLRPPWALADDAAFTQACTRCGDCVRACPQQVLRAGDGGYPEIRFAVRGCTLCGDCARACRPAALRRVEGRPPWNLRAEIGNTCLARRQVECRVCGDACEAQAIGFRPRLGGVALPRVDADRCTGCGACVAPCPAGAVAIQRASAARPATGT
jgi:ferredoxin-type protein NapF